MPTTVPQPLLTEPPVRHYGCGSHPNRPCSSDVEWPSVFGVVVISESLRELRRSFDCQHEVYEEKEESVDENDGRSNPEQDNHPRFFRRGRGYSDVGVQKTDHFAQHTYRHQGTRGHSAKKHHHHVQDNNASHVLIRKLPLNALSMHIRPQPAEGSRRQQTVDESIDHFLDGIRPQLPFPDAIDELSQAVSHKPGDTGYTKDGEIRRGCRQSVRSEISDEVTDQQAVNEPLPEILSHCWGPVGNNGHKSHRTFLVPLHRSRRLHVFVCAVREDVEPVL